MQQPCSLEGNKKIFRTPLVLSPTTDDFCVLQDAAELSRRLFAHQHVPSLVGHKTNKGEVLVHIFIPQLQLLSDFRTFPTSGLRSSLCGIWPNLSAARCPISQTGLLVA